MTRHLSWTAAVCLLGALAAAAFAVSRAQGAPGAARTPRIAVVIARENPADSVDAGTLRRIFLRQETKWANGWTITVYERHTESPIRLAFSKRLFGKDPEELGEYWLNLRLTQGLKPPAVCRSARLVKEYLKRVKGGIGYIEEDELDSTVKRLRVTDLD